MPKKILYESFKSQFLSNLQEFKKSSSETSKINYITESIEFEYRGKEIIIKFGKKKQYMLTENLKNFKFYERGDLEKFSSHQSNFIDRNIKYNKDIFISLINKILKLTNSND